MNNVGIERSLGEKLIDSKLITSPTLLKYCNEEDIDTMAKKGTLNIEEKLQLKHWVNSNKHEIILNNDPGVNFGSTIPSVSQQVEKKSFYFI